MSLLMAVGRRGRKHKMNNESLPEVFLADLEIYMPDYRQFVVKSDRLEIIIPEKSQETGELHVWLDSDEITVGVGEHFHIHFDIYSNFSTLVERIKDASRQANQFIQAMLADKIVIYVSSKSAGCYYKGSSEEPLVKPGDRKMVWSGKIE